jgi:hypothetical protein
MTDISQIEEGKTVGDWRAILNEVIAKVNDSITASGNLADLSSVEAARQSLGLDTAALEKASSFAAAAETYQELRDLPLQQSYPFAAVVLGKDYPDDGQGWLWYRVVGEVGEFTDNNEDVLLPTGGDGSVAWKRQEAIRGDQGIPGGSGPPGRQGNRGLTGLKGDKGDPGTYTGVTLTGTVADSTSLPAAGTSGRFYGVWTELDDLHIYADNGSSWVNLGPVAQPNSPETAFTCYVGPHGDDSFNGRSFAKAVKTLERAVEVVTAFPATDEGKASRSLVTVYPGLYETYGHLNWPDECSVVSVGGARKTSVVPAQGDDENGVPYAERNVFRLGDGGYVDGFSFEGWQLDTLGREFNEQELQLYGKIKGDENGDPSEGFAIAFRPGAIIRRVPYAHNIVAYRGQPPALITAPLDRSTGNLAVGNGGGVVIADGAVVSEYSVFPNIMTWGATPSVPNGIGYLAKNMALLNPVNAIGIWCHKHFMALSGGQCVLSACSSQFGDYSLWAEGFSYSVDPYSIEDLPEAQQAPLIVSSTASEYMLANLDALAEIMWQGAKLEWCGSNPPADDSETANIIRKDGTLVARSLAYCFMSGRERSLQDLARGFFDYKADLVFESSCISGFETAYDALVAHAQANPATFSFAAQKMMRALLDALMLTINNPRKIKERSLVTAIGHQWTQPLAGVTRAAVPTRFGGSGKPGRIPRSVVQKGGGIVRYSGQDDDGNAFFVGGLTIDARSGELQGPPFEIAVRRTATKTTIARSF